MTGRPLSLLVVLPPTLGGGVERGVSILLEGFDPGVIDPAVALTHAMADSPYLMASLDQRTPVLALNKRGFTDQLRIVRALAGYYDRARPDIVMGRTTYAALIALAARRAARHRPPVIVSEHVTPALLRRPRTLWLLWLARRLYRDAAAVVTVSRGMRAALANELRVPARKIIVIDNAFHPSLDELVAETAPLQPPLPPGTPLIVYVGRFTAEKGVAELLRALRLVRRRVDARLLLIGEGPLRPLLETLAARLGVADAVTFAGYLAHPYRYMAAADVFVVPSLSEAAGTALIEGMRAGAAIVATTCDFGPREMITHEANGLLVAPGNPAELAAAITRILSDPELAARLRAGACRESVRFSPGRMVEQFQRLMVAAALSRAPGIGARGYHRSP